MRAIEKAAAANLRRHYRSATHWYIAHDAGQLTIKLYKVLPQTHEYVPYAESWLDGQGQALTINNEEDFQRELEAHKNVSASAAGICYDPGDLNVQWVLPSGEVVEGMTIDAEVEAGTTLCICKDFLATRIEVECDICHITYQDMPATAGGSHVRGSSLNHVGDLIKSRRVNAYGTKRLFKAGGFKFSHSDIVGTTKDLQELLWYRNRRIVVNYCPNVTGDLAEITDWDLEPYWAVWGDSTERTYFPAYVKPFIDETLSRDWTPQDVCVSFHHCGVWGVPGLTTWNQTLDWEYYACPNAKPEDFDGLIEKIISSYMHNGTVNGTGWCWAYYVLHPAETGMANTLTPGTGHKTAYSIAPNEPVIPAFGTLKISNRTADPAHRAMRIAQLQTAGWVVEEVDDSLETGIYATKEGGAT